MRHVASVPNEKSYQWETTLGGPLKRVLRSNQNTCSPTADTDAMSALYVSTTTNCAFS